MKPIGNEGEFETEFLMELAELAEASKQIRLFALLLSLNMDDVNIVLFRIVPFLKSHNSSLTDTLIYIDAILCNIFKKEKNANLLQLFDHRCS